ncbi:putative ribonuclease H-like domain-containing protein [Tanacetum coccineum]
MEQLKEGESSLFNKNKSPQSKKKYDSTSYFLRSGRKTINAAKPKVVHNAVKASTCLVWKPKNRVIDHGRKNTQIDEDHFGFRWMHRLKEGLSMIKNLMQKLLLLVQKLMILLLKLNVSKKRILSRYYSFVVKAPIYDWKIFKDKLREVYQIFRVGQVPKAYPYFEAMLKEFDRDDMVMFEPVATNGLWQFEAPIKSWRLYKSCRVHCLIMEGMIIYMLDDVEYPLPKTTLQKMLDHKCEIFPTVSVSLPLPRFPLLEDFPLLIEDKDYSESKTRIVMFRMKNTENLKTKINKLNKELSDCETNLYNYKRGLSQVKARLVEFKVNETKFYERIIVLERDVEIRDNKIESLKNELEELKKEKESIDHKLVGFGNASKDLNDLLESQKSAKDKTGVGFNEYTVVPPPPAQVYSPPQRNLSWELVYWQFLVTLSTRIILGPHLVEAMQEELLQFQIQNVWVLVDCPKGVRPIGTKWVLKNKKDARGIVIRNKARLVVQGHTQEEGIDYKEVFAPVARIKAIRMFLAYASFMGFTVYQMDVKSAFLYGTIDEEDYVMQPPGFEDPEFPDRVYKVEKVMYGLHQALRAWYGTLSKYFLENGFQRGTIDLTLFIRKYKREFLLVQVYVDDIIFGSSNPKLCREFEALMHDKFKMSAMGELTFFLGLQVLQKNDGIFLSQDKYIGDILQKFGYTDVRTAKTPMDRENPWGKDGPRKDMDLPLYRLYDWDSYLYLTAFKTRFMFVVCVLC